MDAGAAWQLFFINLCAVGVGLVIPYVGWVTLVVTIPALPVTFLMAVFAKGK